MQGKRQSLVLARNIFYGRLGEIAAFPTNDRKGIQLRGGSPVPRNGSRDKVYPESKDGFECWRGLEFDKGGAGRAEGCFKSAPAANRADQPKSEIRYGVLGH